MTTHRITYARVSGYDAAIAAAADVHVISAEGELGEKELAELGDEAVSLACANRRNVVLDLSRASHMDYRAMTRLASHARFVRSAGGDLKLCGLSTYLQAIVRASGTWNDFDIHEDAQAATAAFVTEGR